MPGPGLGAGDMQRNEPLSLSVETSVSAGERGRMESCADFLEEMWPESGLKEGEGLSRWEVFLKR